MGQGGFPCKIRPRSDRQEQEVAQSCKRLDKNAIVCWNYLYLTQKISEENDPERKEGMLRSVAAGSVVSWRHINLLGEYDFSEEKLRDSFGNQAFRKKQNLWNLILEEEITHNDRPSQHSSQILWNFT